MKNYLKYIIWDWLFCACALAGLVRNIYNGYIMTDSFSGNLAWILFFSIVAEGIWFLLSYKEEWRMAGLLLSVFLVILFIIYNQMKHPFLHEQQMSYAVFWIYLIGLGLTLFYLHKRRWGIYLYFIIGNVITAAAVFLQFGLSLPGYLLFLGGSVGLLMFHFYSEDVPGDYIKSMQHTRYALQSFLLAAGALLFSLIFVYGILIPLALPTRELKLLRQLKSMEVIHKVGVSTFLPDIDPLEQASGESQSQISARNQDNTEENPTDSTEEAGSEMTDSQSSNDDTQGQANEGSETASSEDFGENTNDQEKEDKEAINYKVRHYLLLVMMILIMAVIIGSVIYKRKQRKNRLRKWNDMSHEKAVILCYYYFTKTLSLVQVRKRGSLTLSEYSRMRQKDTDPYISGEHNYKLLTQVYEKVLYGHSTVTDEEWSWFVDAYSHFHENIKEEVGMFRYLLLFYRI